MKHLFYVPILLLFPILLIGQLEKVVVEGAIVIADNEDPNPVAGTIRWTGSDFEGYDGTNWLSLTCCDKPTSVTDQEGNEIQIAYIGDQCWTTENLTVTTYNDGTPIPFVNTNADWGTASTNMTPAYCYINDDQANFEFPYGALYNWYAVSPSMNGGKNLCPVGWHVPTNAEYNILAAFLDPSGANPNTAGGPLKQIGDLTAGTGLWLSPNTGATNTTGFNGIPNLERKSAGGFGITPLGTELSLWTQDGIGNILGNGRNLLYNNDALGAFATEAGRGFGCRCVKD